ncbi:YitT family protein [Bengtsoniella intestinalis]|uniref:YitT family protein n=1 Tax=Bengtsoniella intestinalis TaxID=3073143 RepID=UPI00391FB55B
MIQTAYHNKWLKYLLMVIGSVICASGVCFFIVPMGLYNGGILGFCQLIRTGLLHFGMDFGTTDIAGILYYMANVPVFIYCYRKLGFKIVINSLLVTTVYTLAYSIIPVPTTPIVEDMLTSCILGGLLAGVGAGLYLTSGATGGGIDLIALMLAKAGSNMSVGKFAILINMVLYGICLLVFEPAIAIYSVIYSFVTSIVLDRLHQQNVTMQAMVFTRSDEEALSKAIMEKVYRGVTHWEGVGAYTNDQMHVLCICLSKYEIETLERVVREADPNAFIIVQEGVHVVGNYVKKIG